MSVVVLPSPTSIVIEPSKNSVRTNDVFKYAAKVIDQFGAPLAVQPSISWQLTPSTAGVINSSSGIFTASSQATAVDAQIQASAGSLSAVSSMAVVGTSNKSPVISVSASAIELANGGGVKLSVLGSDDGGEANLKYLWKVVKAPIGATSVITPSTASNSSKNAVASTPTPGLYKFTCAISDALGLSVGSDVSISVVGNQSPVIVTSPAANLVSGFPCAVNLAVLGKDDGPESDLIYTWKIVGATTGVIFIDNNGTNRGKNIQATVPQSGSYTFSVEIKDKSGASVVGIASIVVPSTPFSLEIKPERANISPGCSVLFTAKLIDAFGNNLGDAALIDWSIQGGGQLVNGLYTAGAQLGKYTVTASSGTLSSIAEINNSIIIPMSLDPTSMAGMTVVNVDGKNRLFTNKSNVRLVLNRSQDSSSVYNLMDNGDVIKQIQEIVTSIDVTLADGDHNLTIVPDGALDGYNPNTIYVTVATEFMSPQIRVWHNASDGDRSLIESQGCLYVNNNSKFGVHGNAAIRSIVKQPYFGTDEVFGSSALFCRMDFNRNTVNPATIKAVIEEVDSGLEQPCNVEVISNDDKSITSKIYLRSGTKNGNYAILWSASDYAGNSVYRESVPNSMVVMGVQSINLLVQRESSPHITTLGDSIPFIQGITLSSSDDDSGLMPNLASHVFMVSGTGITPLISSVDGYSWIFSSAIAVPSSIRLLACDLSGNVTPEISATVVKSVLTTEVDSGSSHADEPATKEALESAIKSTRYYIKSNFDEQLKINDKYGSYSATCVFPGAFNEWHNGRTIKLSESDGSQLYEEIYSDGRPTIYYNGSSYRANEFGWHGSPDGYFLGENSQGIISFNAFYRLSGVIGGTDLKVYDIGPYSNVNYAPPRVLIPNFAVPSIVGLSYYNNTKLTISNYSKVVPVHPLSPMTDAGYVNIYPFVCDIPPSWVNDIVSNEVNVVDPGVKQVIGLSPLAAGAISVSSTIKYDQHGMSKYSFSTGVSTFYGNQSSGIRLMVPTRRNKVDWWNNSNAISVPGAMDISYAVYGSKLYWENDGYSWLRTIKIDNDVINVGKISTLRILGGFCDKKFKPGDFSSVGDYVHFVAEANAFESYAGGDLTVLSPPDGIYDENKITILGQRLVCDSEEPWRVQTLEVDVYVGNLIPRRTVHVDIKLGAVKASPGGVDMEHEGINGSHRMINSLQIDRVAVDPQSISIAQLQKKDLSIRINGQGPPPANTWLDISMPNESVAAVKADMKSWTVKWDIAPHVLLLSADVSTYETIMGLPIKIPDSLKVRMLGGKLFDSPEEAILNGDQQTYCYQIDGPLLEKYNIGPVIGYVTLKRRQVEIEPFAGFSRFPKAPFGSPGIYGNGAVVRLLPAEGETLSTMPNIKPTSLLKGYPATYGENGYFQVVCDRDSLGVSPPARLTKWDDGSTFRVVGNAPGTTFVSVNPIIGGLPWEQNGIEIPIQTDVPLIGEPSIYQLETARINSAKRKNAVVTNSQFPINQDPTPAPTEDGSEGGNWRLPSSREWFTYIDLNGKDYGTHWENAMATKNSRMLDAWFDVCMHLIAQIVPTGAGSDGDSRYDGKWHSPLTSDKSIIQTPVTQDEADGKFQLSIDQIRKVLLWGKFISDVDSDEKIRQRFISEAMPQSLWLRTLQIPNDSGTAFVMRPESDEDARRNRMLMEAKLKAYLDQAVQLRLKRYFSLAYDYRTSVTDLSGIAIDGNSSAGFKVKAGYLPMLGAQAKVDEADLWQWILSPSWWGKGDISRLFSTPLTFKWHVGHPFTVDIIRYMILERQCAINDIIASWKRSGLTPVSPNWPIVYDYFGANRLLDIDQSGRFNNVTFRIPMSELRINDKGRFDVNGTSCFIYNANEEAAAIASSGGMSVVLSIYANVDPERGGGTQIKNLNFPLKALSPTGAVLLRAMYETELLEKALSQQAQEEFFQTARLRSPISYWVYVIGDAIAPGSSIHALITGYDFISGKELRPEEWFMHSAMAAISVVPGVASGYNKMAKAWTALGKTASKDLLTTTAGNLATSPTVRAEVRTAVAEMADGGKNLATQASGVAGWAGRVSLTVDSMKGLTAALSKTASGLTDWFIAHCGTGSVGPNLAARKGSLAPVVSQMSSLETMSKHVLPDPQLARLMVARDSASLVARQDPLLMQKIAAAKGPLGSQAMAETGEAVMRDMCFPAGTLVLMADGASKPIETLQAGDVVLSRDQKTVDAPIVAAHVKRTFVRTAPDLVTTSMIEESGATMTVSSTTEHPFWVMESGWKPAQTLTSGDMLAGPDAAHWKVVNGKTQVGPRLVYNFEVEGTHSYFVGGSVNPTGPPAGWVWVHNSSKAADIIKKITKDAEAYYEGTLNEAQKIAILEEVVADSLKNAKLVPRILKDANGRVVNVTADLKEAFIGMGTAPTAAARRAIPPGYDAGHIIAMVLGGRGGVKADNIVAILTKINRGRMAQFEGRILGWVKEGKKVSVEIKLSYGLAPDPVPVKLVYTPFIDGVEQAGLSFDNLIIP